MAIWQAYEDARGSLTLVYRNLLTGQAHKCGVLRRDTPTSLILDWIFREGDPSPGDLVALPGGVVLQLLPPEAERELQPAPMTKPVWPDWRRRS